MKRLLVFSLFIFLLLKSSIIVFANQDWEYWSKYSLEKAWSEKAGFSLKPEFRFKGDFKDYYYFKTYLGLFYQINNSIKIETYYAYRTKKDKADWKQTNLLYLDPSLKFNLGVFELNNRFRFEYDLDKEELVYRNRLKIKRTIYTTIDPYMREEIFYSFLSEILVENRFSVGCSVNGFKYLGFSAEYMLKSKKTSSSWKNTNVLVSGLSFKF